MGALLWLRNGFIKEVGNTFESEIEWALLVFTLFKKGFVIGVNGCWFSVDVYDDVIWEDGCVNCGLCVGFDKGADDWKGEGFNCAWGWLCKDVALGKGEIDDGFCFLEGDADVFWSFNVARMLMHSLEIFGTITLFESLFVDEDDESVTLEVKG